MRCGTERSGAGTAAQGCARHHAVTSAFSERWLRYRRDAGRTTTPDTGHRALAAFIRGYVQPAVIPGAHVLYVEDSRTVAVATTRMLQGQQLRVTHMISAEEALEYLRAHRDGDEAPGADLVLTDVYLKGELSGRDLVQAIRNELGHGKRRLPVLVMLAINLEPIYAIVLAVLLLDEQRELGAMFYAGVAIILAGVFAHPLLSRRPAHKPAPELLATAEAKSID